jgi:clan AA aspartic protease (TIGR02281 family)
MKTLLTPLSHAWANRTGWTNFAGICALSGFCFGLSILGWATTVHEVDTTAFHDKHDNYAYLQMSDQMGWNFGQPTRRQVVIPFRSDSRALMVDAQLNRQIPMTFVLDTGATYTAISYETAYALGYDLRNTPKINVTTAGGRAEYPKIILREVSVNGYTVHDVEATVMPLPKNAPFSGLLGLSFIRRHKMTIDPISSSLILEAS